MMVKITSRKAVEAYLRDHCLEHTAVICFYDLPSKRCPTGDVPVDYRNARCRVFSAALHDIDREVLPDFGLTYDTYFPEAGALAEFILDAVRDGLDIVCQCEYGQSRSAACAAAILEHFCHTGINVFADYRYYPNQMVYHKIKDALDRADFGKKSERTQDGQKEIR